MPDVTPLAQWAGETRRVSFDFSRARSGAEEVLTAAVVTITAPATVADVVYDADAATVGCLVTTDAAGDYVLGAEVETADQVLRAWAIVTASPVPDPG